MTLFNHVAEAAVRRAEEMDRKVYLVRERGLDRPAGDVVGVGDVELVVVAAAQRALGAHQFGLGAGEQHESRLRGRRRRCYAAAAGPTTT